MLLTNKSITACLCLSFLVFPVALFAQKAPMPASAAPQKITSVTLEKGTLVFFVLGDWGRNGEYNQTDVAESMRKTASQFGPEFVISTGDNFYTTGVASTQDPQWMTSFENVYKGNDLQIDWYVVLGNHDYHGNAQAEVDYTKISRRWRMPSRYFTNVYSLKGGKKARFVYMDTNPYVKKYHKEKEEYGDLAVQDTAVQTRWLDSVLTHSKEEWKFVIGHHPVYSSSKKHGNTDELIDMLKPRLEKHNVQVYLCGHDHDLQHQKPATGGVDYFVSGAGSEVRDTPPYTDITKFAKNSAGFAMVCIKNDQMTLYFIDTKQNIVYQYTRTL
jgi:predicted MPP superfamily phosphohydrolase